MSDAQFTAMQRRAAFSDLTLAAPISDEIARRQFTLSLVVVFLFLVFEAMTYMRPAHADPMPAMHGACHGAAPFVFPSQAAPPLKPASAAIRYG
jgi:hypothetical protein